MSSFTERMLAQAEEELRQLGEQRSDLSQQLDAITTQLQKVADTQADVRRFIAALAGDGYRPPTPDGRRQFVGMRGESLTPEPQSAGEAVAEAVQPKTNGHRAKKKSPKKIKVEQVRDFVCTLEGQWSSAVVREHFDIASSTAKRLLDELVNHKPPILEQHGTTGRYVRYEYIAPPNNSPTHRPRHDHPRQNVAKTAVTRGITVPRTGKMIGPSGKPGMDKKRAEQGKRVKRHRVGS